MFPSEKLLELSKKSPYSVATEIVGLLNAHQCSVQFAQDALSAAWQIILDNAKVPTTKNNHS